MEEILDPVAVIVAVSDFSSGHLVGQTSVVVAGLTYVVVEIAVVVVVVSPVVLLPAMYVAHYHLMIVEVGH